MLPLTVGVTGCGLAAPPTGVAWLGTTVGLLSTLEVPQNSHVTTAWLGATRKAAVQFSQFNTVIICCPLNDYKDSNCILRQNHKN